MKIRTETMAMSKMFILPILIANMIEAAHFTQNKMIIKKKFHQFITKISSTLL